MSAAAIILHTDSCTHTRTRSKHVCSRTHTFVICAQIDGRGEATNSAVTRVATNAIDYGDTVTSISGRFHQSAGMVTMCMTVYTQRAPDRACMSSLGYRLSDCSREMSAAADRARRTHACTVHTRVPYTRVYRTHACTVQTSRRRSRLGDLEMVLDGV